MPYNLSIPGQVSEYQLKAIEAVATLVPKGGKVVEVGSLFGCSSWAWAKSVDPSVTVYCIDPWEKNEGVRNMEARYGVTYGIEQFLKYTADCQNVRAMQGYSPDQFQDWSEPIDLYYEDAVHTDPVLARNLTFWTSKLKSSGIICGDDYRPRFPDVRRGAESLAAKFKRELIRVDFFWCLLPDDSSLPGCSTVARRLRKLQHQSDALKRNRGPILSIGPRFPVATIPVKTSPLLSCRLSNEGLDPWPPEIGGPLIAGVRVVCEETPATVLAESRVTLPCNQLQPDVPLDFELVLPAGPLHPGKHRAIYDIIRTDGYWMVCDDVTRARGIVFEIV